MTAFPWQLLQKSRRQQLQGGREEAGQAESTPPKAGKRVPGRAPGRPSQSPSSREGKVPNSCFPSSLRSRGCGWLTAAGSSGANGSTHPSPPIKGCCVCRSDRSGGGRFLSTLLPSIGSRSGCAGGLARWLASLSLCADEARAAAASLWDDAVA